MVARLHNIPPLAPYPLRYAIGWALGTVALMLEPLVLEVTRYFGMGPPVHESHPNGSHAAASNTTGTTTPSHNTAVAQLGSNGSVAAVGVGPPTMQAMQA